MIGADAWADISPEQQTIVRDLAVQDGRYASGLAIERGEKARAGVAGSGVTVSEVDPAPFKEAVSGVCAELNFEEEAKIVKRAPGQ